MKRLFIMHTQYNLILSASILHREPRGENTLVLFSEFTLTDEMHASLNSVFDHVIVARDAFYAAPSALDEVRDIRLCLKKTKCLKRERFDEVYMSQERIFDMILLARAKKNNPAVRCYNVEEDAYYSINETYNDDSFVYEESFRMKRRKLLFALCLLGYSYDYRDFHYCYGMSRAYDGANLLFPSLARRELRGKTLLEISSASLLAGIDAIYATRRVEYPPSEKYALIFFDLMNRYKNPEKVRKIVASLIEEAKQQERTVLLKYHPRETDKFPPMEGAYEIPHIIPAEKVLYDLQGTDTVVLGNATTSCVVAAKLGFRVYSICKLEAPTNKKMHDCMTNMGLVCVTDPSDIKL